MYLNWLDTRHHQKQCCEEALLKYKFISSLLQIDFMEFLVLYKCAINVKFEHYFLPNSEENKDAEFTLAKHVLSYRILTRTGI